jgi:hypothetical protein
MLYDPTPVPRSVNMVDWNSEGTKIATAYAIMEFQQQPENMSLDSYVWDISNPNTPEFSLKPLSQVVSAKFNLKDPNIVGAGLYNGQFAIFDMRKGSRQVLLLPKPRMGFPLPQSPLASNNLCGPVSHNAAAACAIERSHIGLVTMCLTWLPNSRGCTSR